MTPVRAEWFNRPNSGPLQACRMVCGLVLLFLVACTSLPSHRPNPVEETEPIPPHEYFELEGKLAVKHGKDGFSATFTWSQRGPDYSIRLWGPLGQGRTLIEGDASAIEITTADGKKHSDSHPQRLMQQWLGWSVPLGVFRYWIQGRSAPQLRTSGTLERKDDSDSFEQLGWQIVSSRYRAVEGGEMPMKTVAETGDFKITLIIRKARLGKVAGSLDSRVSRHQNSRLSR